MLQGTHVSHDGKFEATAVETPFGWVALFCRDGKMTVHSKTLRYVTREQANLHARALRDEYEIAKS